LRKNLTTTLAIFIENTSVMDGRSNGQTETPDDGKYHAVHSVAR